MIKKYKQFTPIVGKDSYIFSQAVLLVNVEMGKNCIVYPNVVIRGEDNKVIQIYRKTAVFILKLVLMLLLEKM